MIGKMRHLIAIERPVETGDGGGGRVVTWTAADSVWAAYEPTTWRERFEGGAMREKRAWRFVFRAHTLAMPITTDMRVKHAGRILRILAVKDLDDRGRYQAVICEDGSPDL